MRQFTVTLATLTVTAIQSHAGILDRLFGSPAKVSSADPIASFERGIARLQDHGNRIFHTSEKIDITRDIQKTDSLIQPIVGVVEIVVAGDPHPDIPEIYDLRLAFRDGSWVIASFTFRLPDILPIHVLPDSDQWKVIQACFVSDEATEAAVKATPSSSPAPPVEATSSQTLRFVTITQSVSLPLPYGATVLPVGTQLEFISREGSDVRIRYAGREYAIPISATDLK